MFITYLNEASGSDINNLDWVAQALCEDIDINVSGSTSISNTYISKEDDRVWLHVKCKCEVDLVMIDPFDDLDWNESDGYSFPDNYSENDINDLIRWFNLPNLELEDYDGNKGTFECKYVDHDITNNVDFRYDRDGDLEDITGEYFYEIEFKLSRNNT